MPAVATAARAVVARASRFGPRSSKKGNRLYNRGRGAWKGGFVSSTGRFIAQDEKKKFIVVPDLTGFELKAYVARDTPKVTEAPPTFVMPPPAPIGGSSSN